MDGKPARLPGWVARRGPASAAHPTRKLLRAHGMETVCENARCPNAAECFGRRVATFMILGRVCTRTCGFCAVAKGRPAPPDPSEPRRLAAAAAELGLAYVVVTSVTRDDLPDGGASHFAAVAGAIGARLPGVPVEVLTPDFGGSIPALETVLEARPAVFNHNVETVPRLYAEARPGADYRRSLGVIARAAAAGLPVKSGLMVGLGETDAELEAVMTDLAGAGCGLLTVGQYLAPSRAALPVRRFVAPEKFDLFAELGYKIGFKHVAAGPLVRSSYRAMEGYSRALSPTP